MRSRVVFFCALALHGWAAARCGERHTLASHAGTQMPYSWTAPAEGTALRGVAVLLAGADGQLKLDADGCPQALKGNFLIRSAERFREAGYATVLVDVPSDHRGTEGLEGFRGEPAHAQDLGRLVTELRARARVPVWMVGTSRGSISAANVASRALGEAAPDGLVLSSVITNSTPSTFKPWLAQTVFDLPLAAVHMPAFVIGHAQDPCVRTPADRMPKVLAALGSARKQMLQLEGGSAAGSGSGCEGRSPHGFAGQEAEAVDAMLRFMQQP